MWGVNTLEEIITMNLRLDSHVDSDGRIWLQLLDQAGQPVAMVLCPVHLWAELKAGLGIVEGKLVADGLLVQRDLEVAKVPGEGDSQWN
jgi:hypothetical protein